MTKKCSACKEEKEIESFNKDKAIPDGYDRSCKICRRRMRRETYFRKKHGIKIQRKKEKLPTPEKKTCYDCKEEKPSSMFHNSKTNLDGLCGNCKQCAYKKYRSYIKSDKYKEKNKEYSRTSYLKNREENIAYTKEWRKKNPEKVKANEKKFRSKPIERAKKNLRGRLKKLMSGEYKYDVSVGCSKDELIAYLESKFQKGMTWENYGSGLDKWHIDHIKPLASFDLTQREQRYKASHFSNLQPLWGIHNEAKGDNYDPDHPMGWRGLDALME